MLWRRHDPSKKMDCRNVEAPFFTVSGVIRIAGERNRIFPNDPRLLTASLLRPSSFAVPFRGAWEGWFLCRICVVQGQLFAI